MSDFGAASCAVEIPDARLENSFLCSCSVFQEGKPHFFFSIHYSPLARGGGVATRHQGLEE